MWKSKFIINCGRKTLPLIRNKVNSNIPTLIPSKSPHFSVLISQNPRFFSSNSTPNDQINDFDLPPTFISQQFDTQVSQFDENSFFSQDSSLLINPSFDEKNPIFSETESSENPFSFLNLDENAEKSSLDEKNPNFSSQESEEHPFSFLNLDENATENSEESVTADQVFDESPVTEIEQVQRILSLLQSSLDGPLESRLDELKLNLNEEIVVKVVETPLVSGDSLIKFFRWASEHPEFVTTTRVVHCLVKSVGMGLKTRESYFLWDLVKEIGEKEKGVLNTEILNDLISLFFKLGKGKAGYEVFNKFEEFGCEPNSDSYYLTIKALCRRSIFEWAWLVCEKMLTEGKLPDCKKIGEIITLLCNEKRAKDAHLVYQLAKEKNKSAPQPGINILIRSLSKEDDTVKIALDLLDDFSGDARKYAIKPFSWVVNGLCKIKEFEEAKKLLLKMTNEGPPPGNTVFNYVINGLSKAGEMDEAMKLVKIMESRGLRPDVYTYTVIMSGYVKGGDMDEAQKVLSEAKKNHSRLTPVMFHILTRGYCKLEDFDKAVELLNEMKESSVKPNADEYSKMIQSLCLKALDWKTAEKLLEEMKENGLYVKGDIKSLVRSVKELEEQELCQEVVTIEA